ncbi:DUF305 domain-containing protein [Solimonas sp. SE-A11]|uniref:DUF305 domain-containing protein n=1 Tax=Solimonas sp. SE-A11 TaxID=3054954 RepID=UPI00259CCCC7|nr:DUF305 domain-containing protein [Solimonas sp. SE-A11]
MSLRRFSRVLLLAGGAALLAAAGYAYGLRASPPQALGPSAVDVGFAQFMRSHHDQAIVMTEILLADRSSKLAGMASAMQAAQLIEIGQMKGWLLLWDKPLLPASDSMDWMLLGQQPPSEALNRYLIACRNSPGGMPGLATAEELQRLHTLQGDERDRLFLQLMVKHHQGGLPMAQFAVDNARAPAVRLLAAQMVVEQTREMATMALMARRASPAP